MEAGGYHSETDVAMILTADWLWPEAGHALKDGGVRIVGGAIAAVGPRPELTPLAEAGEEVRHLAGACLLPGLINAHTHLELAVLGQERPVAHDFVGWLLGLVEQKRRLEPDEAAQAAAAAVAALVAAGTTGVGDIASIDVAQAPLLASGLRVRLDLELLALDPARADLALGRLADRFHAVGAAHPDSPLTLGVSPHAPYTLSDRLWERLGAWRRRHRAPLTVHMAESRAEVALLAHGNGPLVEQFFPAVGWGNLPLPAGPSPLDPLARHGLLQGAHLIHGCHLTPEETTRIAAAAACLCHCARSNAYLGQPPAPVARWLAQGIPVGLGTDSLASCPSLDLWEELAFAYLWHRTTPEPLTAEQLLTMATAGSARCLGWQAVAGALTPGRAADVIAVEVGGGSLARLPERLLFDRGRLRLSLVAGRPVAGTEAP